MMIKLFRHSAPLSDLDLLEKEANDEFHLLEELGPEYFGWDHLMELLGAARERLDLFDRRQKLAMTLGGTSGGWVAVAMLAKFLTFNWLALFSLTFATISIGAFFVVIIQQKKRFNSRGDLVYTLHIIEDELRGRAEKRREANL